MRIQERLSELSLDVKGKLNSWMEGGREQWGLLHGMELLLEQLGQAVPNLQNPQEICGSTGSPQEKLVRVSRLLIAQNP